MIVAFIDEQRGQGHAVGSICRVLREQGLVIAARTYRSWKHAHGGVAARTVTDAQVVDVVRDLAWRVDERTEARKLTPGSCAPPSRPRTANVPVTCSTATSPPRPLKAP